LGLIRKSEFKLVGASVAKAAMVVACHCAAAVPFVAVAQVEGAPVKGTCSRLAPFVPVSGEIILGEIDSEIEESEPGAESEPEEEPD
jgi:hypothetical protein